MNDQTVGTEADPGALGRVAEAPRSPWLMLAMATIGFAVNFWAWALISPLGPLFRDDGTLGTLTESDVALMVAVPVVVGSLGRILVGALTDKLGGRVMFPLVSAATILPILFLAFFALDSYALILVGGFFLGIAGTAFAVGVPFVNAWFPPEKRGLAIGIFGAGMGGTAISALTTVKLSENLGARSPFLITAAVLAVYAGAAWLILRDAPGRTPPTTSLGARHLGQRAAPDHLAGVHPLRRRLRWLRRVLGLPPVVPQDCTRAHPGRRREPDGRVRGRRGDHAAGGRLALRQARRHPGAGQRLRRGGGVRCDLGRHPAARAASAPWPSWPWPPRSAPAVARPSRSSPR